MGLMDKLKNVFFEEEEIEIEERPRKVREEKKEKPVAKKIDLPEMKRPKSKRPSFELEDDYEEAREDILIEAREELPRETRVVEEEKSYDNFSYDDYYVEKRVKRREERRTRIPREEIPVEEEPEEEKQEVKQEVKPVVIEKNREEDVHLYEGSPEKRANKAFKPTPIISPIYGILDKNYKKEDVVTKKEVRLSSVSTKKIDLDSVREKAYGDLTSDITSSIMEQEEKEIVEPAPKKENKKEKIMYDLTEEPSPIVSKVTMGDAEEYFNELGLEYNVDYKDTHVVEDEEERVPRRSRTTKEINAVEPEEESLEDNLFDLIESMYDEKE